MSSISTPKVHELAKAGFGTGTNELYDRARPSYQPEALSLIRKAVGEKQPVNIVEIGSGTGIFTRALFAHPEWQKSIGELKAVEPSEGMRDVFVKTVNDARASVAEGTFDQTGVQPGWADLVVIAQAFHWCPDFDAALQEFARVLKPGGIVVFIWNLEDRERARWVAQVRETYEKYEQGSPQFRLGLWRQVFSAPSYEKFFQPHEETTFSHTILATEESVGDRVYSKSYIAVQSKEEQKAIREAVREILERGEDKVWVDKEKGVFEFPYNTFIVVLRQYITVWFSNSVLLRPLPSNVTLILLSRPPPLPSSPQSRMSLMWAEVALSRQPRRIVLSCAHRRPYSSLVSTSQETALDDWIAQTLPSTRAYHDDISPSKVADLFCTLPTRDHSDERAVHAPLRPLHSLAFFHARTPEEKLGADQTDRDFCPPLPFARRMWAGGAFRFPSGSQDGLRVGASATARVKIGNIEKKGFAKGAPMLFMHQNIEYVHQGEEKPLVTEERIHVYLPRELRANARVVREVTSLPKPQYTFSWTPTPTTLFRFSALTWNGHLIHLDPAYARNEEGYPERLVHGPLIALMLVEALYYEGYSGRIDNFVYRARNPTLVGRLQFVRGVINPKGDSATVWVEDENGVVGMTGTVGLLDPGLRKFA